LYFIEPLKLKNVKDNKPKKFTDFLGSEMKKILKTQEEDPDL